MKQAHSSACSTDSFLPLSVLLPQPASQPTAVVGVRAAGIAAKQSPTTSSVPA